MYMNVGMNDFIYSRLHTAVFLIEWIQILLNDLYEHKVILLREFIDTKLFVLSLIKSEKRD